MDNNIKDILNDIMHHKYTHKDHLYLGNYSSLDCVELRLNGKVLKGEKWNDMNEVCENAEYLLSMEYSHDEYHGSREYIFKYNFIYYYANNYSDSSLGIETISIDTFKSLQEACNSLSYYRVSQWLDTSI